MIQRLSCIGIKHKQYMNEEDPQTIDVADMLKDIDMSEYTYLDGLTSDKIGDQIYSSLTSIPYISPETIYELWLKLTEYRFVYSLNQLRMGRFIRWISVGSTTQYKLSYGGMVVDIEITPDCPMVLCKTPVGKLVKFDFNKNRVYQKLTGEEKLLILCSSQVSTNV